MLHSDQVSAIIGKLQEVPSGHTFFNQYVDTTIFDLENADSKRRANLQNYLLQYSDLSETLILAEAPGPWGCRFTGIPITSEVQLADEAFPIDGEICTAGPPRKEYSAGIFWRVLQSYLPQFIVWNSMPFHPHKEGELDSIRPPTKTELEEYSLLTQMIVDLVQPSKILALGRRAHQQLELMSLPASYIRHPSQGGATTFEAGMIAEFSG